MPTITGWNRQSSTRRTPVKPASRTSPIIRDGGIAKYEGDDRSTHTGPLASPDGKSLPATNKPVGFLQAHWIQTDAIGNKVVKEAFYSDSGTLMAQLGVNPAPARPVMTSAVASPTVAIAGGSPAEQRNVDAFKAQIAAFNAHDAKGSTGDVAPDAVFRDVSAPKDQSAKENIAGAAEMFKAFPDAKLVPSSIWGAGDYVVVVGRFHSSSPCVRSTSRRRPRPATHARAPSSEPSRP